MNYAVGDVITIAEDAPIVSVDGAFAMRGNTYIITKLYKGGESNSLSVHTDYNGGWWIRPEAIAYGGVNKKTSIERKIAVMYKRFENRKEN